MEYTIGMRRLLFVLFFFVLVFTTIIGQAMAAGASLGIPIGGLITTTNVPPNVICSTGIGPITIKVAGKGSTSPYLATFAGNRTPQNQASSGRWFLGLYQPGLGCVQENGPESHPYPTLNWIIYGVSGMK